jgi:hypothetical protein
MPDCHSLSARTCQRAASTRAYGFGSKNNEMRTALVLAAIKLHLSCEQNHELMAAPDRNFGTLL